MPQPAGRCARLHCGYLFIAVGRLCPAALLSGRRPGGGQTAVYLVTHRLSIRMRVSISVGAMVARGIAIRQLPSTGAGRRERLIPQFELVGPAGMRCAFHPIQNSQAPPNAWKNAQVLVP